MKEKYHLADVKVSEYGHGKFIVSVYGSRRQKRDAVANFIGKLEFKRTRSPVQRSPQRKYEPKRTESSMNVTVPDALVARLIGKHGENVKNIMKKTGCSISFQKAVSSI